MVTREASVGDLIDTRVERGDSLWMPLFPDYTYQGEPRVTVERAVTLTVSWVDSRRRTLQGKVKGIRVNGKVTMLDLADREMTVDLAVAAIDSHRATLQAVAFGQKLDRENRRIVAALLRAASRRLSVMVNCEMYMREPDAQPGSRWRLDLAFLAPLAPRLHALVIAETQVSGLDVIARFRELRHLSLPMFATAAPVRVLAGLRNLRTLRVGDALKDADLARLVQLGSLRGLEISYAGDGTGLKALGRLRQLEVLGLRLGFEPGRGDGLASLAGLPLRQLHVAGPAATEAWLAGLGRCPTLVELILSRVSASRLAFLPALSSLRRFVLNTSRLEAEGLAHLGKVASLEHLSLLSVTLDERAMAPLGRLPRLRELSIGSSALTGAGLVHLSGLRTLRHLDLSYNKIPDGSLGPLSRLADLEELRLSGNPFGDQALATLDPLRRLKLLLVPEKVTRPAREAFARRHPGCQVQ
jgi:hypothetical protein